MIREKIEIRFKKNVQFRVKKKRGFLREQGRERDREHEKREQHREMHRYPSSSLQLISLRFAHFHFSPYLLNKQKLILL